MVREKDFEAILRLPGGHFRRRIAHEAFSLLREESLNNPTVSHYPGEIAFEKEDFTRLNLLLENYIAYANAFVLSNLMCLFSEQSQLLYRK